MPRISRIDRATATPEVAEVYDHFMKIRGNIPNMFRTAAHRPEIMRTLVAHFRAVMETGTVPAKLKKLVIVPTTQVNRSQYGLASHTFLARRHCWPADPIND